MAEIGAIHSAARFAYRNAASRHDEKSGADFAELLQHDESGEATTGANAGPATATRIDEVTTLVPRDAEVVTYTMFGGIRTFGNITGRIVDSAL